MGGADSVSDKESEILLLSEQRQREKKQQMDVEERSDYSEEVYTGQQQMYNTQPLHSEQSYDDSEDQPPIDATLAISAQRSDGTLQELSDVDMEQGDDRESDKGQEKEDNRFDENHNEDMEKSIDSYHDIGQANQQNDELNLEDKRDSSSGEEEKLNEGA